MVTVINQVGASAADAVRAAVADVELVDFVAGQQPPAGLQADVFFGGYSGWDGPLEWCDATGVQWIQLTGTGVDALPDGVYGNDRIVTCARGASAVPISEWVMAAVLAHAKRMPETFLSSPPKHWNFPQPPLDAVSGSTLALVGLGGIGTAVAERALPFGMRVKALRRTETPSPVAGVEVVTSLEQLVDGADHLVLAAPATARTQHLIDADVLALVKPGLHLVNIARGALVDQDALRDALDDGRVAMATLDTVTPEPLPDGHWMYAHPNVRVAAHISWYSPAMLGAAIAIFVENLARFVRGEPLMGVVDRDEGY